MVQPGLARQIVDLKIEGSNPFGPASKLSAVKTLWRFIFIPICINFLALTSPSHPHPSLFIEMDSEAGTYFEIPYHLMYSKNAKKNKRNLKK